MVSRNNHQQGLVRQPHYGLRKLEIGLASVLLSTSFWLGMSCDVRAAVNTASADTQASDSTGVSAEQHQVPPVTVPTSSGAVPNRSVTSDPANDLIPTTSINDWVGQGITVTNHTITEAPGDKDTGNPGTVTLHLGLTIPAAEIGRLQAGNYIDVKLGLPYATADGQHEVFSYGAVSGRNQVPLRYAGQVVGYILPAGNLASYQQSVPGTGATVSDPHWQVAASQNNDVFTNAGSNGYYRIVFNSFLGDYFRNNQGQPGELTFNADLVWYNPSGNGDKKLLPTSQALHLYTVATNVGCYTPSADLQIGDQHYASGISLQVIKASEADTVPVATKITSSDHTGAIQAHTWEQNGNQQYLKLVNPTQSVGISLSDVGSDFTIVVAKPASNSAVETNFVSAADLQRELQKVIVPVLKTDSGKLADQLTDASGLYLTQQYIYQKPVVTVERTDNGPDEASYHIAITGAYAGFRSTNSDGSSPVTLLTWRPLDQTALLPDSDIQSYQEDQQRVTYGDRPGHWLGGHSVQNAVVREYMNSHPWHVQVVSQGQTKFDVDWGYWIGIHNDLKPASQAYIDATYYGFVNQVIYFVDEQGQAMRRLSGAVIPPVKRQLIFTSKTGQAGSYQTNEQFEAIRLPVVDGYTAYLGSQSAAGQLVMVDGKAKTTGTAIRSAGQEAPFEFPHADFVEYIVYKRAGQEAAHLQFYDDTAHRFIPGMPELTADGTSNAPISFTVPSSYDLSNYDYVGTYVGNNPLNMAHLLGTVPLNRLQFGNFDADPHTDQYFIAHFQHRISPISAQKAVTETIHYVDATGRQLLPDYNATLSFRQTGYRDLVTGVVTSVWSGPENFLAVVSPAVTGYLPNIPVVAAVMVSHTSADVERTVVYRPSAVPQPMPVPSPTQRPEQAAKNIGTEYVPASRAVRRRQAVDKQLPQTGSQDIHGIIASGLVTLALLFGLSSGRRKNN